MSTKERVIIENLFLIADKEQRDVPFILNSVQSTLDTNLTGRDIIPKARQEGVSSYFLARYLAKCLYKRNTRAVVISHERESTQRLLNRVHYMLNNIRGPKAVISHLSKNEIVFPKTSSMFYLGTAGSRKFGRGDTITDLHCSEVSVWSNALELMTGLLQSVPESGEIAIESTGNGVGNYYHKMCEMAASGESQYRLHFFNWQDFAEYKTSLTQEEDIYVKENLKPEWEEPELVSKYNLTSGQLVWRRRKLEELQYDLHRFKQEYPMTLDECFQSSGHSLFPEYNLVETADWKKETYNFARLINHPKSDKTYIMGVDVSGGVGQDSSIIEVFAIETLEQVAEFADNRIGPDVLAEKVAALGAVYNNAYIVVESNNHGIVTLKELIGRYPSYLLYRRPPNKSPEDIDQLISYGFHTTSVSKPYIIGKLRRLLKEMMVIHSPLLAGELSTFVETSSGQLQAEDGCKDDRVMATAVMTAGIERAAIQLVDPISETRKMADPFSFDTILEEFSTRGNTFPISSGVVRHK